MIFYGLVDINPSESIIVRRPWRDDAAVALEVRALTKSQHEVDLGATGLTEFARALEHGDFEKIAALGRRSVVLIPRPRGAVLIAFFDGADDLIRMMHLDRYARRRLARACLHARAATGDQALFDEAFEDARLAKETVIV